MKDNFYLRILKDKIFHFLVIALSIACAIPLILGLIYMIKQGISSINWQFFVSLPRPAGEPGGGIANAIVGTLILITIASFFSVPFGIATALYLYESGKGRLYNLVSICVDLLQGIPSIVIGIVAYLWIVRPMGRFSAFSGGIALAFMMLPVIVRSAEETLKLIPESLKEASLSLGIPHYRTILKVILPAGLGGILSGVLIGIARIGGETAPLLFTAFGNPFMNLNIFKPVEALPHIIFNYAKSPFPEWHTKAWGAAFVLVVLVFILNILTKLVMRRWKVQF